MIHYQPHLKLNQDAAVIFLTQDQVSKNNFPFHHSELTKLVRELSATQRFTADRNKCFPVVVQKKLVLLFGLGKKDELTKTSLRVAVRRAVLSDFLKNSSKIEIVPSDIETETICALIEGVHIGTYVWNKYKGNGAQKKSTERKFTFIAPSKPIFQQAEAVCEGVNLTRDLVNENADVATSVFLEKTIRDLIKGKKNFTCEVLNERELKRLGMGFHLAVNQGSNKEPKLIIVRYHGSSRRSDPYVVLLGKGMTYDTGGLNLKGSGNIETMRMDMAGAAAVVGVLKNIVSLRPKKNVLFACAIAENAIGSNAYKPGDVIRGFSGKTVEVANTDAEGRLVLADAMSYIIKKYKPARLIDVATLTGACVIALGHDYTGLVSTDDTMATDLLKIAKDTDDRAWRLPIYPELKEAVKSHIADIRNLGFPKGAAGTITAAEFLRQFSAGTRWAHLDIAGTAFVDGCERMYFSHGGTGAGVRLLTRYIQDH